MEIYIPKFLCGTTLISTCPKVMAARCVYICCLNLLMIINLPTKLFYVTLNLNYVSYVISLIVRKIDF